MAVAVAPDLSLPAGLRDRLSDLYADYVEALDQGPLESWPGHFTEECLYQVMPRDNFEQKLPIAVMTCESRAMLIDRTVAIRELAVYAPRIMRHLVSTIRVQRREDDGWRITANFLVTQALLDQPSEVFLTGRYHDLVVERAGRLLFAERICVYDSTILPTSLVYPI